ncbi:hypothetical protein IBTHAUMO2_880012 [Nitrosopumilaceae archaeon]|nr:hypothetical protein IBTHAUMO2_880012 [Nitrosopumilaceae archaeon]
MFLRKNLSSNFIKNNKICDIQ